MLTQSPSSSKAIGAIAYKFTNNIVFRQQLLKKPTATINKMNLAISPVEHRGLIDNIKGFSLPKKQGEKQFDPVSQSLPETMWI